jgi:hypothetical protein
MALYVQVGHEEGLLCHENESEVEIEGDLGEHEDVQEGRLSSIYEYKPLAPEDQILHYQEIQIDCQLGLQE